MHDEKDKKDKKDNKDRTDRKDLKSVQAPSYIPGGLYTFLFCVIFSFVFFIWIIIEGERLSVNQEEINALSDLEEGNKKIEVKKVKKELAQPSADPLKPIWISQSALITKGEKVYQMHCSVCHGASGAGDGLASKGLNPPPQDLVTGEWKYGGDSISLFKSISDGISATSMAAFKHLSQEDRWALVHFIRSITKNKVKDNIKDLEDFGKKAE